MAAAQAVPTIGSGSSSSGSQLPFHGTAVSYGHQLTADNPTPEVVGWSHRIGLMPEYHFNKVAFFRARLYLSQEFTPSDSTNTLHEIELSDLWVDAVWTGFKEKNTGIRIAGDLRTTFPTSKFSQGVSRLFTLGPSANVSRSFNVLGGLSLIYSGRFTWRFNRFTTRQNDGGFIINCGGFALPEACIDGNTGRRVAQADIIHGPTISFSPHARLNISGTFLLQHGFLPRLSPADAELAAQVPSLNAPSTNPNDYVAHFAAFSVGVTYTPWDPVSLTLGAFTFSPQLAGDGKYIFPLFNRNTVVSLDATFDIEAAVSSFTKEKK
ncbi:MAG: hypothetical protein JNM17_15885 [Archangium sp.]|nr:hypothetical protein [Archangium sp.]